MNNTDICICPCPRPEHPNPQWERSTWRNLNGKWEFDFDFGVSALERKVLESGKLSKEINVPFCPESKLSGIEYKDFIPAVCYRKVISLDKKDLEGRVILHFGAVDYETHLFINGKFILKHLGGYSSFEADITDAVKEGENVIFLWVKDDVRSGRQPKGKQAHNYFSHACDYTRTTGIWQTVWLEFVPCSYIKSAKFYPDIKNGTLTVIGKTVGTGTVTLESSFEGKATGSVSVDTVSGTFYAQIKLTELHLWELGKGGLYDLKLSFGGDEVKSYFGMRSTELNGLKYQLNGKTVFQRTVLDQGFYPDGIYTAPTEDDLVKDIHLSMACGFNGARLHQKVFEARFLYHCDKIGYMVWGEHANWGLDYGNPQATEFFINEWMEIVERDFNHPAIIGWCPFNETWGYGENQSRNRLLSTIYRFTKQFDITRPVIDTSGNFHCDVTDIYDVHDYEQRPDVFKANYDKLITDGTLYDQASGRDGIWQHYKSGPVFVSEYGGIQWNTDGNNGWGYGEAPKSEQEFLDRYKGLTDALLDNPKMLGFCYTQLYDIEQEINGLYTYDRVPKFDVEFFKKVNTRKAAIED